MKTPNLKELTEFIVESNHIEDERSDKAHYDAMNAWFELSSYSGLDVTQIHAILATHRVLMRNKNPRIAGEFRKCDVRVGNYVAPKAGLVRPLLEKWVKKYNNVHAMKDCEEQIKQAHIEFEKIHPFEDGNGRVGRIIMNYQRMEAGLPILIIHEGKEQMEYYKWFREPIDLIEVYKNIYLNKEQN